MVKPYKVKGKLLFRYKKAKKRSTKMRLHWAIARRIQKDKNLSLGDARRAATNYVRGAWLIKGKTRYVYRGYFYAEDGTVRGVSVPSNKRLSKRKFKQRARKIWDEHESKYEELGLAMPLLRVESGDYMYSPTFREDG